MELERRATIDQINSQMFEVLAVRAEFCGLPWNVFNMNLCLKAVQ
jgi:hypothetical protein